jgi:phosphonate transport system substrate-binding protein
MVAAYMSQLKTRIEHSRLPGISRRCVLMRRSPKLACAFAFALSASVAGARPLVIGTLSTRPDFHVPRLQSIAQLAAASLHDYGIDGARVLLAKDVPQICEQIKTGRVDWVSVTMSASFIIERDCGARSVLRALDQNNSVYRTVFFARKDSGISSLPQLLGKRLALRNRGSTSSFVIPKLALQARHLPMLQLRTRHETNQANQVNLVFSGSETNSALWVVHGLADASVANSVDWLDETLFPALLRQQLVVFYESEDVPLGLEMFSDHLAPNFQRALQEALLQMPSTEAGRAAIQAFAKAERFELISPQLRVSLKQYADAFAALNAAEFPITPGIKQ